jgi:glucose/arabinose dehydrogenase
MMSTWHSWQWLRAVPPWQARWFAAIAVFATSPALGITFVAPDGANGLLRVTTFAQGLNYPVGMADLDDGSLLVAVTNGSNYFGSSSGSLIRLVDADGDGVAEQQQTLVANVPGGKLSALRRAGSLVAVTGQGAGTPISLYRLGANAADPLSFLGSINLNYPSGGWLHPHSALAFRQSPGDANAYELYFQLGSDTNFAVTTRTVMLSGAFGASGALVGDSIHRLNLVDGPGGLAVVGTTHIATGLRNPTGLAFHPQSGDLYIGDNGIDGVVNANEPTSADEINVIAASDLGVTLPNFGFPSTYTAYRTGDVVGNTGTPPVVAFQPLPPPDGSEAEGLNEIAFAPPRFPLPLEGNLFVGFHGRFNLGGIANEENPLAAVDLDDGSYIHVVPNSDSTVGHLDGLISTADTLYLADISTVGAFSGSSANSGKIYAVRSLIPEGDYDRDGDVDGDDMLRWQQTLGVAQANFTGADGDGSGLVDAADLEVWGQHFGASAFSQRTIPEPNAAVLVLVGLCVTHTTARVRTLTMQTALSASRG